MCIEKQGIARVQNMSCMWTVSVAYQWKHLFSKMMFDLLSQERDVEIKSYMW